MNVDEVFDSFIKTDWSRAGRRIASLCDSVFDILHNMERHGFATLKYKGPSTSAGGQRSNAGDRRPGY